jgi:2-polyprenyl-3-methyl-5-hydroxy-6-metoxy-1,4-benzoquinol methylase
MIREKILEFLANNWPSPLKKNIKELGEHLNSDEYNFNYALKKQFLFKVNNGFPYDFFEKEVLEIGCGQGGISTYLALNGAKNVIGIDINKEHILSGQKFINRMEEKLEVKFQDRLTLIVEDAGELSFKDNSFDIIIADNVFEHFMDTEKILSEAYS